MNFQKLRQGAFGSESVIMRLKIVNPKLGGNPKNREVHQGNSLVIPGLLKARHFIVIKATAFHPWMASKVESCIFWSQWMGCETDTPRHSLWSPGHKNRGRKKGSVWSLCFFLQTGDEKIGQQNVEQSRQKRNAKNPEAFDMNQAEKKGFLSQLQLNQAWFVHILKRVARLMTDRRWDKFHQIAISIIKNAKFPDYWLSRSLLFKSHISGDSLKNNMI